MCSKYISWLPEQALQEVREAGAAWERQAQEAASQLERLKDLLEESALWRREQPPRREASPPNPPGVTPISCNLRSWQQLCLRLRLSKGRKLDFDMMSRAASRASADVLDFLRISSKEALTPIDGGAAGENGTASSGERNGTEAEDRAAADSQYIQAHILDLEQRFMQVCSSRHSD